MFVHNGVWLLMNKDVNLAPVDPVITLSLSLSLSLSLLSYIYVCSSCILIDNVYCLMYVSKGVYMHAFWYIMSVHLHVYMCMHIVNMHVCMYMYMYIDTHMCIYFHILSYCYILNHPVIIKCISM